ncbi:MAG: hypothetical protein AB7F86_15180 [Bdellovibrionales bacterium]
MARKLRRSSDFPQVSAVIVAALFLSVIVLAIASPRAWSQAGSAPSNSGLGNVKDLTGLCTADNKGQLYYDSGYCASLRQFLTGRTLDKDNSLGDIQKKTCGVELMKRLYLRYKDDEKSRAQLRRENPRAREEDLDHIDFDRMYDTYDERTGKPTCDHAREAMEKSFNNFSEMVIQWLATVVERSSSWNTKHEGDGGQGLIPQNLADMDNEKDECGCKVTNSSANAAGSPAPGESPGPLNGHHNIMCASYRILKQVEKDGQLYGGSKKDKPKDIKGASVLVSWLRDPEPPAKNEKSDFVRKKMIPFCAKYIKNGKSEINTMQGEGGQSNPILPNLNDSVTGR